MLRYCFARSLWAFHLAGGSCNNCDIEVLDLFTPRFDVERFGIQLVGSIRHADVLVVTGCFTRKSGVRLLRLYEQIPRPFLVVAMGNCANSMNIFVPSYNVAGPLDRLIPVNLYIPGCPPKPEAMIDGFVQAMNILKGKK